MLEERLVKISEEISAGNDRGEKITLLGATKFVDVKFVNEAISLGLTHIGENKAQEFRDKFPFYLPVYKHFIGTLQSNKLKYVVGKADFIDSVSSITLAKEISAFAEKIGAVQSVMVEINAGGETNKSGASFSAAEKIAEYALTDNNLKLTGVMGMLPESDDENLLADLCEKLRDFYDKTRVYSPTVEFLSVGMSSDYKIAIKHGSNMIRLGNAIFSARI